MRFISPDVSIPTHAQKCFTRVRPILLKTKLSNMTTTTIDWERLADIAVDLSYAEVARAGEEAIKNVLIDKEKHITENEISLMLTERKELKERLQRIR